MSGGGVRGRGLVEDGGGGGGRGQGGVGGHEGRSGGSRGARVEVALLVSASSIQRLHLMPLK